MKASFRWQNCLEEHVEPTFPAIRKAKKKSSSCQLLSCHLSAHNFFLRFPRHFNDKSISIRSTKKKRRKIKVNRRDDQHESTAAGEEPADRDVDFSELEEALKEIKQAAA